jgi:alkylhydroperoxidase/carboxymuconolactone decarboxylase family protein YurZ
MPDGLAEGDTDWIDRCARLVDNPWSSGVLPVQWLELISIALDAASTHRDEIGVRRHIRAALAAGATREEIVETLKGVTVLGIHSVAVALPILFEEATRANVPLPGRTIDPAETPVIEALRARGLFNPAWEAIYELDPVWLEQFLAMGSDLYQGVLPAKLVELMALAVDASCTHLYVPGIRRHISGALEQGASFAEIMEVLKLCGALGTGAFEFGTAILDEEVGEDIQAGDVGRA